MSREIKFRAWSNGQKAMLEVGDNYGTTHDLDCCNYFKSGQDVELMQFTGLTDKNGKDIYEGDIVNSQEAYQSHFIIEWGNSGWVLFDGNDGVLHDEHDEFIENVEVIGNIYEHGHLLKG